jgi:hypothetical protein
MNPAWKELFIDVKSLRQIQIQQSVAAFDFHSILSRFQKWAQGERYPASIVKEAKIFPNSLTQQSLSKSYQAGSGF